MGAVRRRGSAQALLAVLMVAQPVPALAEVPQTRCGDVITLRTHGTSTTAYSLAMPPASIAQEAALVLLPGGGGRVALDAQGCATSLNGNFLVRSRALFHKAGFATALVDVPSDHRGEAGLAGFRLSPAHAEDIGKVIADVRALAKVPVWLVGTSRGTISAVSAAGRLAGTAAPDGVILTSPITAGRVPPGRPWGAQTVFGARLGAIRVPLLVVAHAADTCPGTPPRLAGTVAALAGGTRKQTVTVSGGLAMRHGDRMQACQGRSTPHGFAGQEAEVVAGIGRFVRGEPY